MDKNSTSNVSECKPACRGLVWHNSVRACRSRRKACREQRAPIAGHQHQHQSPVPAAEFSIGCSHERKASPTLGCRKVETRACQFHAQQPRGITPVQGLPGDPVERVHASKCMMRMHSCLCCPPHARGMPCRWCAEAQQASCSAASHHKEMS